MRRLPALIVLGVLMSACRADVDVTLRLEGSGAGTFGVVFAFDEEFLDVVRASADGRRSLDRLREVGSDPSAGWRIRRTEPDGGLRIHIERDFTDPASLRNALAGARDQGALSFLAVFRDLEVSSDSSLFRNSSAVRGNVDLSPERLAPGVTLEPDVRAAFEQAARSSFRFAVTATLPGRVSSFLGDPEKVSGGTVVWSAPLGKMLRFSADASAVRAQAAIPAAALGLTALSAAVAMVLRIRRRRRMVVPGWDHQITTTEDQEV